MTLRSGKSSSSLWLCRLCRRPFEVVCLSTVLCVTVAYLSTRFPQNEPSYAGRPLSSWLQDLDGWNGSSNAPPGTALRHFGSDAVPHLLSLLREKDNPIMLKIQKVIRRQSIIRFEITPAHVYHRRAQYAFYFLGDRASSTSESLVNCAGEGDQALAALCALDWFTGGARDLDGCVADTANISDAAADRLSGFLTNRVGAVRTSARKCLFRLTGASPRVASRLAVMQTSLMKADSEESVRLCVLCILTRPSIQPELQHKAIDAALTDSSPQVRRFAAQALDARSSRSKTTTN